jgi:hypothetical protein
MPPPMDMIGGSSNDEEDDWISGGGISGQGFGRQVIPPLSNSSGIN